MPFQEKKSAHFFSISQILPQNDQLLVLSKYFQEKGIIYCNLDTSPLKQNKLVALMQMWFNFVCVCDCIWYILIPLKVLSTLMFQPQQWEIMLNYFYIDVSNKILNACVHIWNQSYLQNFFFLTWLDPCSFQLGNKGQIRNLFSTTVMFLKYYI